MTGGLVIERAGPAHALVLAAIHADAFPDGEAWSAAMFAAQLGQPGVFALLGARDGAVEGMVLARVAADEGEILTLAVAGAARRRGLGRALLGGALEAAAVAGAATVYLEVSSGNEVARALYETAGFGVTGQRRGYYADGSDAVTMARAVTRVGDGTGERR